MDGIAESMRILTSTEIAQRKMCHQGEMVQIWRSLGPWRQVSLYHFFRPQSFYWYSAGLFTTCEVYPYLSPFFMSSLNLKLNSFNLMLSFHLLCLCRTFFFKKRINTGHFIGNWYSYLSGFCLLQIKSDPCYPLKLYLNHKLHFIIL